MNGKQRHTRRHPCPICGGYDEMPRGKGVRCDGWNEGDYCHCSRDELAGRLDPDPNGHTYCHRMVGDCRCGQAHDWATRPVPISTGRSQRARTAAAAPFSEPTTIYDYGDFQVCRFGDGPGKTFKQRRPDGRGGYVWNLDGIEPHLYRRDELLAAPAGSLIIFCEGEKGGETCRERGLLATCSPMGAGKWRDTYAADLASQHVIIIADHDQAGRDHAATVTASLAGIAASVRIVEFTDLDEKADAFDFFAAGGTVEELFRRALTAPEHQTDPEPTPHPADQAAKDLLLLSLARDLSRAQADLAASRDHERTRRHTLQAIEDVLSSSTIKQELKAPYCRFLLARTSDRRFADVETRPVAIWLDQVAEMNGGADAKTVKRWLETMAAENLGDLVPLPGPPRTLPNGRRLKKTTRLAIQIGPRPGEAPMSLAAWRELMCNPRKLARRTVRKPYERIRCADDPDAILERRWYCTKCGALVGTDHVHPETGERVSYDGKSSTASSSTSTGNLPVVDGPPPFVEDPAAPAREDFPSSGCACEHGFLPAGGCCYACEVRSCAECGRQTASVFQKFCPVPCRGRPDERTVYTQPPAELAQAYATAAGGD